MNKLEYKANKRLKSKWIKQASIEQHHILGKINSSETIPLCKPCHDYITAVQNNYPPEVRQEKETFALISLYGLFDLCINRLNALIEAKITKTDNQKY